MHPQHEVGFRQFDSSEKRHIAAKALTKLFNHWHLNQEQQCELLGLSKGSRKKLKDMADGSAAISNGRDAMDRAAYLLSIHKALRLLYPRNPELLYGWVTMRNAEFDYQRPLDIMLEQGLLGLAKVARYLDFKRGR